MKQLTQREKELVVCAIETATDTDNTLKSLSGEYDEIIDKITYEVNDRGNRVRRGFSFAGCNGTELDIFSKLRGEGYSELYYDAPYNWGVANLKEFKIYTYCEGDTTLVECKDATHFKKEMESYYKFQLEHDARSVDGDSVVTFKKAGVDAKWSEIKKARGDK